MFLDNTESWSNTTTVTTSVLTSLSSTNLQTIHDSNLFQQNQVLSDDDVKTILELSDQEIIQLILIRIMQMLGAINSHTNYALNICFRGKKTPYDSAKYL